ncbi:Amidase domain-containing protein [Rubrivivax sp. A210]|uniref:amidase n=1 Tax=Rubrivivax sp. A210 TaxID=2772301 RepID=UPI00191A3EFB|nr:amidase [Rubrivivax sp. A210]CAD5366733.1 Amidase domain-containing protein [Rubrivivax sp. A210]
MKPSLNFLSASQLAAMLRTGEVTSRQTAEAYFSQIKKHNSAYNAIVTLNEAEALAQADQADRSRAEGKPCGPLHGVPITIKDTYRVKGSRTTAGYLPLKDHIPDTDAVAVALLKEAGAIVIGRTNTPTLAMDMQTDNPIFGRTNNPWDVTRTPGGSSGGCATALATGMTSLSLGSDLAGSIRLPAGFCGVYGLKPTHGVVSFEGHVVPLPGEINGYRTLAVAGPLARSIDDLALALDVFTQPTSHDRNVAPLLADMGGNVDISKLKIAWADDFGGVPVSAEIKDKLHAFVKKLAQAGATVHKVEPQGMDYNEIWETWGSFVGAQGNYDMSNLMRAIGHLFSKGTLKNLPMQRKIVGPTSVKKLMQAFELQSQYITKMDNFLSDYDAWLCPVSATTAFKHHAHSKKLGDFKIYSKPLQVDGADIHYYLATQAYTTVFSTTNSPVVSMPIGLGPSGLPVNLQVAGKRYSDRRLLQVAKVLDDYTDKFQYPLQ